MHPLGSSKGLLISYVVDATSRTLICHCERDGISNIFDITARPLPVGSSLIKQDGGAAIIHAFDVEEQPMLWVSRPMRCWQPQDRRGQICFLHSHAFNCCLIVIEATFR